MSLSHLDVNEARPCGTRAAYEAGCRCQPCQTANRRYVKSWKLKTKYGAQPLRVPVDDIREHILALMAQGMSYGQMQRVSGINDCTFSNIVRGRFKHVYRHTAEAIMAIRFTGPTAAGDRMPVHGFRRRMGALVALGWPMAQLAQRLGLTTKGMELLMRGTGSYMRADTLEKAKALYEELSMLPAPPSRWATRARNYARKQGWPPPLAWDDEELDDPSAAALQLARHRARAFLRQADQEREQGQEQERLSA